MGAGERYFAMSFSRSDNGGLVSGEPQNVADADEARRLAFRMAMSGAGGIAFYCVESPGRIYHDAFILEEHGDVSLSEAEPVLNPRPLIWWRPEARRTRRSKSLMRAPRF
jgi:hypothetical protein